jgi:hypothetical protein
MLIGLGTEKITQNPHHKRCREYILFGKGLKEAAREFMVPECVCCVNILLPYMLTKYFCDGFRTTASK